MIAAIQRRGRDSQDSDMNLPISRTVAITDWYHLCDIITLSQLELSTNLTEVSRKSIKTHAWGTIIK